MIAIGSPDYSAPYADHRAGRSNIVALKKSLIESNAQVLDGSTAILARSEGLWNGVLGSAMRTSRTSSADDEILTYYRYKGERVKIVTTADGDICHVDDQRTIRAIITMVHYKINEKIRQGEEVVNEFYIDLVDLCAIVGLSGGGANRSTFRESIQRLYGTNFCIAEGGQLAQDFGLTAGADESRFSFISEMDTKKDREFGGSSVRKPRWYRIVLHSKTFENLANEAIVNTYVDNKEILKLKSGLMHIYYTWCSINVKRSGNRVISKTLREINQQIIPHEKYKNFKSRFISAIKQYMKSQNCQWSDNTENTFNLSGYIIAVKKHGNHDYILEARRDIKDPAIGNNSKHNQLLRDSSEAYGKKNHDNSPQSTFNFHGNEP